MNAKKLLALLMAMMMALCSVNFAFAEDAEPAEETEAEATPEPLPTVEPLADMYTYKDAVNSISSNWNPHTYQTADESYPMDYTTDSLYSMVYNDANHPLEGLEPYEGYVIVPEMAADYPVDVTEAVKAAHPEFNIPEDATQDYAWAVKLRSDLKWDDGTPIKAEDFVGSLERVLRPELLNYRAVDYYSGSYVVVNTEKYSLQGSTNYIDNGVEAIPFEKMTAGDDGVYTYNGSTVYIAVDKALDWCGGNTLKDYVDAYGDAYFGLATWNDLLALADEEGLVPATDDNLKLLSGVTTTNSAWGETDADLVNYLIIAEKMPDSYDFSNVGLFASAEDELTFVFKNPQSYGYYLLRLGLNVPLVKIDLYDECLKETTTASGTVWTSTYNTSLETTASYGPYKMDGYQRDKSMHFVKNENWFGWTDGNHVFVDPEDGETYPMYQTTAIDAQQVTESATTKTMFLAGQLMGYGLQAEDFDQYRSSEYCYATPGQAVFGMVINGYLDVINEREAAPDFDATKVDYQMMTNNTFRRALAVAIDRDLFAATISPARSGGYGLIGTLYVYDPETGALYRDTDQAKRALCEAYSINLDDYNGDLDAAAAAITGYDPVKAAELFTQAFNEGIEAGYITDADGDGICDQTITMIYSTSTAGDSFQTKTVNYLNECFDRATEGTPLAGKVFLSYEVGFGDPGWSDNLRAGLSDMALAGWSGAATDPFGFADTWTNENAYWNAWFNPKKIDVTMNIAGEDITMNLRDWALCLNGENKVATNEKEYNFGYGQVDVDTRLTILATIEREMLLTYNSLPVLADGSMALLSQQVYYVVEEYSPMMGRGGIAYLRYNYDDAEWAAYVAEQGGSLQY